MAVDTKDTRCAAWLWYRGDRFRGYQAQPGGGTVQQTLEAALLRAGVDASVSAPSGRTDLGVHARMQVLSLRLPSGMGPQGFVERISPELPADAMGFVAAHRPHPSFQAHWSAAGKEYRYRYALGDQVPEPWRAFAWPVRSHPRFATGGARLDPDSLARALGRAAGARDFIAFHEKSSVRKIRSLESATLHELGGGVFEARFVGDGFGRHQVRYLAGAAALVAAGVVSEQAWEAALDHGTPMHGVKAPAEGLVLWEVRYPEPLDPFPREERASAPGLPRAPPF